MSRRPVTLALLSAAALALAPAPARADVEFFGTLTTPAKTVGPTTDHVLYYLQMRSGDREERFSVWMLPPSYATSGGLDEGQTIDGPRAIALQGPGTIASETETPLFAPVCSDRDRFHGYTTGPAAVDVLLPPRTSTTLAVRYTTGLQLPWVDSDYRLTFQARPQLVGDYDASSPFTAGPTLTRTVTRRTAGPAPDATLAAHLLLSSSPRGTLGIDGTPRSVSKGRRVRISGRLLPGQSGRKVIVQAGRDGGRLETVATTTTARGGRFAATWTPARGGTYDLWARYPRQAGGLQPDTTSCPLTFRVR